jgi:PilZ domain-containing protein
MLPDTTEHPCQVRELTIDGAVFATELPPPAGLPIVAYIDSVGRIVGLSDERVEGGFKVKFTLAGPTRARLASRLESLTKHPEATEHAAAVESAHQRALRYEPENSSSHLGLSDGRVYACEVVDISLTGAAIKTNIMPTLGTYVMLGKMRGRIVRYTDQGIAIEFVKPLDRTSLAEQIR